MTLRINCWSGPRNISTALMYSFRERVDTTVIDEPFYAHYLRVSGREHPGYQEVLDSQDQYSEQVIRNVIELARLFDNVSDFILYQPKD